MIQFHSLEIPQLERFLERQRSGLSLRGEAFDLDVVLRQILQKAFEIGHKTHSIVAVPIYIGKHVCGVLELINRLDGKTFTQRDMVLLEIFAGYTSFMLQNAL